ncbi:MAG: hypothetical protein HZB41_02625 [Ignavibacteriae bacterium]|nr:hypothetical protein [Ignavibacteriota bacterium]
MKNKKYILNLLIIITVFISTISCLFPQATIPINPIVQVSKPIRFFAGLSYTNSIPLHDYSRDLMHSPKGFSIDAGIKPRDYPFSFGINVECLFLDNKNFKSSYVSGTYSDGWTSGISFPFYGNVGYGMKENSENYDKKRKIIVPVSVFAKFEPSLKKFFRPFIELSVGVNTQYVLGLPNIQSKFNILLERLEFEYYYLTYFYGLALGTNVYLNDIFQTPDIFSNLILNIKLRYIKGIRSASIYRYTNFFEQEDILQYNQNEQGQIDFIFYSFGLEYLF